MKSLFLFASISLLSQIGYLFAQPANQSFLKPRIGVTVFSDGQPTNQQNGIKRNTKEFRFEALLDTTTDVSFQGFQSKLLIKDVDAILARNGRPIAQISVADGHLPTNMIQQAQPLDHLIFKFTLAARRKNGELVPLSGQHIYNFPIRE